jgi:hypothetical protein
MMTLQLLHEEDQAEMENIAESICDVLDGEDFVAAMAAMGVVMVALYNAHAEDHPNIDDALLVWIAVLITSTIHRRHRHEH